jgi:hypothetical protein
MGTKECGRVHEWGASRRVEGACTCAAKQGRVRRTMAVTHRLLPELHASQIGCFVCRVASQLQHNRILGFLCSYAPKLQRHPPLTLGYLIVRSVFDETANPTV